MGFSNQFKNLRFYLNKRSKRLRGAPLWQDQVPEEKPAKNTYRIAAKYQSRFSRIFLNAVREFLPERMPLGFKAAYRAQSPMQVEDILFGVEFGGEEFAEKIQEAYAEVVQASGDVAMKEVNKEFDTNFRFSINIEKAEPAVPIIPVNDYSVKWMRERSLSLVQDLNEQQKKVIQQVLGDGFEMGVRAEETYDTIRANIGLTGREATAVKNRKLLLEDQGFPDDKVTKLTDKYREQLLRKRAERIARTETIAADSAGRRNAWQLAQDSGSLPEVHRVWISAPPSPNPNRPCEICLGLDGTAASINGTYESSIVGPVSGPGPETHPS